jgi:hypothetical protein
MQVMTGKDQLFKGGRQSSNVQRDEPPACREIMPDPNRNLDVIYLGGKE